MLNIFSAYELAPKLGNKTTFLHQDLDDLYGLLDTFNWVRSNTVPVHIMNAYGTVETWLHLFLIQMTHGVIRQLPAPTTHLPPPPKKNLAAPIDYEGG